MKQLYFIAALLLPLLSIICSGSTNIKQLYETQGPNVETASYSIFLARKKRSGYSILKRKHESTVDKLGRNKKKHVGFIYNIPTKMVSATFIHPAVKSLYKRLKKQHKTKQKATTSKRGFINKLVKGASSKQGKESPLVNGKIEDTYDTTDYHTDALNHIQENNAKESAYMNKYNSELQSSLDLTAKDNTRIEIIQSSDNEGVVGNPPLISYEGSSTDSNPVRIEYVVDGNEDIKQNQDKSVEKKNDFEGQALNQDLNESHVDNAGPSLKALIQVVDDSSDINFIVSTVLKGEHSYQDNNSEILGDISNLQTTPVNLSKEAQHTTNDENGVVHSNKTKEESFSSLGREIMKAVLLLRHSKHPTKYNKGKQKELHAKKRPENNDNGVQKDKNEMLGTPIAANAHAPGYGITVPDETRYRTSHQVLLEYFKKEHELRKKINQQVILSSKPKQEQDVQDGIAHVVNHSLSMQSSPNNTTSENKPVNLNVSIVKFDFNSTATNISDNTTTVTEIEAHDILNTTTKSGTNVNLNMPSIIVNLVNHVLANYTATGAAKITNHTSSMKQIQGKGTIDAAHEDLHMDNTSNNLAFENHTQNANVITIPFNINTFVQPDKNFSSQPLNISNTQESGLLQQRASFVLPANDSFLQLISVESKTKENVQVIEGNSKKEENAKTREKSEPIQIGSLDYAHKKRLQTLLQLETNISVNFLGSWIYHYRSLDGLGLTPSMLKSGFGHYGSSNRLQRMIMKALSGNNVNLLIVGGSISAGGGIWKDRGNIDGIYDRALIDWWNRIVYPLTNSRLMVNEVAIGGTDSEYFSYCIENYIKTMPDVVLWEMAANDYNRYVNRSFYPAEPLERLTRLILNLPSRPAVIYVNFFRGDYYKTTIGNDCPDSEDEGEQNIAEYYNITSLSWRNMICSDMGKKRRAVPLTSGTLFSNDGYHPSLLGHAQMACLLITYIKEVTQDVISKERKITVSNSDVSKTDIDNKSSSIPAPLYTDQTSPSPRCWTLLTPDYNSQIGNTLDSLIFTKAENFEFTNITHWPVRSDRLRCLRAQQSGAVVQMKFFVSPQTEKDVELFDGISTAGREIAITTHNSFGGSAEVWLDQNFGGRVLVVEPTPGQRRTRVSIVKKHVTSGMHTLTIRTVEKGFCLSAVMVG